MKANLLDHISVCLDDGPDDDVAFLQAMDWAARLKLPIRAVIAAPRCKQIAANLEGPAANAKNQVVEKMKSLGKACALRSIVLEMYLSFDFNSSARDQYLRPRGLCLCIEGATSPVQRWLMVHLIGNRDTAMLLSPREFKPMTRILVLSHQPKPMNAFLENAARLCHALEIQPVILIIADSEREANLRQGRAEAICASLGLLADFDLLIDNDLRSAVRRVATWRSCSHVIIDRELSPSWWQFRSRDLLEHLRGLSDSLSIFALPAGLEFDLPREIGYKTFKFPVHSDAKIARRASQEDV